MEKKTGSSAAADTALPPNAAPTSGGAERIAFIELLRVMACFLVIVNHTAATGFLYNHPSPTWFCSVVWFFLSKAAVPVFLMITGAMLLKKADTPRKAFRRFYRVFVVFFVGSAGYFIYYERLSGEPASLSGFLQKFFSGGQATNAYWYFYLYLALLCSMPLLQKMASALGKKEVLWLLVLSLGLVGGMQLYNAVTPWRLGVLSADGLLSPYIGMLFAGYYLEAYTAPGRRGFFAAGGVLVLLLAAQTAGTWQLYHTEPEKILAFDLRTSPLVVGSAICLWIMVRYLFAAVSLPAWLHKAICWLGSLTFTVYLVSDLIIQQTQPLFELLRAGLPLFAALVVWEVLVFALCAAIAALLRAVPFLRKWL